jgi:hypothetical protein
MLDPWLTADEAECLAKYARLAKGDFVELGTFEAAGTEIIHQNLDRQHNVWTIDCNPRPCAVERIANHLERAYMVIGETATTGKIWGSHVGAIIVDGGHQYKDVYGDYHSWRHTLSPSSYLLFHDARNIDNSYRTLKGQMMGRPDDFICQANEGVHKFVNELLESGAVEMIEEVDTMAVVKVSGCG